MNTYEFVNQQSMPFSDHVAIQIEEAQRNQQPYQVPPKVYLLRSTTHPIEEIGLHTDMFQKIQEPYREFLFRRLCDRAKLETMYSELPAPSDVEILKRIIGENGHYLKLTTGNCNVDFIWHDRDAKLFRFWAPKKYSLIQAMNIIRGRIIKYVGFPYDVEELFMNFPPPPPPPSSRQYRSASPEPITPEPREVIQPSFKKLHSVYPTNLAATPEPAEQIITMMRSMSMHYPPPNDDYDDDTDDEMPALI
jgi:hypothetical protein